MSRILLDTNILIHRESSTAVRQDIGLLFRWLDRLHHEKCIHPLSVEEIRRHGDPNVVRSFEVKLASYHALRSMAPDTPGIVSLRSLDVTDNDRTDTAFLAELATNRVDLLITEDRGIHRKAESIGLAARVFGIDSFLEKVNAEHPELTDYRVLSVRKELFGTIDVTQEFFDSLRASYPGFDGWFNRKADEYAYVCRSGEGDMVAFLYLKIENEGESYSDITPSFGRKKRLKIGTLKVVSNGFKLGERFLKVVFDNALVNRVNEIYVTMFDDSFELRRLRLLLEDWGFRRYGTKNNDYGAEIVMVRDFMPSCDRLNPQMTFPFISRAAKKFIVPIYPAYHTELLPDSILNTESPVDFEENRPNRNAISKVYISRSFERNLASGDVIVFYRTASNGPAYYTSVATTIGVVQRVTAGIPDLESFVAACRRRSVFNDAQLAEHWNYRSYSRPFVVDFLYCYSFPRRPIRQELLAEGILGDEPPRGFTEITDSAFERLMELANADRYLVVD